MSKPVKPETEREHKKKWEPEIRPSEEFREWYEYTVMLEDGQAFTFELERKKQ